VIVAVQKQMVDKLARIERTCGDCADVKDKASVVDVQTND